MNNTNLKVVVFLASVRPERLADRVAKFVIDELKVRNHKVILLDPLEQDLPILKTPIHYYSDPSEAPNVLKDLKTAVESADAFITITPEYNGCIPPALSNMLDHLSPSSYAYRPVGLVSYSPDIRGGVGASLQLRIMFGELGALTLPIIVALGEVDQSIDAQGVGSDAHKSLLGALLDQLEFVATTMKAGIAVQGGLDKCPKAQPYL